ncbi:MAG TPA: 5-oxoprolinase subunit PxpA [Chthoniobacterales bacterium]|nr:5-oxoprolinase subunit PxpA [Chthoniobacterales bacterium]
MNPVIDLNADLGEGAGHDEEILELVSSANIACGFHAGDPSSIFATIQAALERNVSLGAHPSFPDRENFGRSELTLPPAEIYSVVAYQIGGFQALARAAGGRMNHVKPHGALYNMAARDPVLADVIANAVRSIDPELILFAPHESELDYAATELGLATASEVFADRNYLADGRLVPRSDPRAFVHDPMEAAERIVRILEEGKVRAVDGTDVALAATTVCVHGDNPAAVAFVRKLRERLEQEEVLIAAPAPIP